VLCAGRADGGGDLAGLADPEPGASGFVVLLCAQQAGGDGALRLPVCRLGAVAADRVAGGAQCADVDADPAYGGAAAGDFAAVISGVVCTAGAGDRGDVGRG